MAKGLLRRSFLRGLLATLFAPWLARRAAAAAAATKPESARQRPQTVRQERASGSFTCVYDPGPRFWTLADKQGSLITTYVYDGMGRLLSVQGQSASTYM